MYIMQIRNYIRILQILNCHFITYNRNKAFPRSHNKKFYARSDINATTNAIFNLSYSHKQYEWIANNDAEREQRYVNEQRSWPDSNYKSRDSDRLVTKALWMSGKKSYM